MIPKILHYKNPIRQIFLLFVIHSLSARAEDAAWKAFQTPAGGVTPDAQRRVVEVALAENWQDAKVLRFKVRRTAPSKEQIWCYTWFENSLSWRYQCPPQVVPRDASWAAISLRFGPGTPDWFPAGHSRDLDDFALYSVKRLGLKRSVQEGFSGKIEVRDVTLERVEPSKEKPRLYDFIEPKGDVPAGDLVEIGFRLDRPYTNPFDPQEANIRARFIGPKDKAFEVLAYYHQNFSSDSTSHELVPVGAGEWRIRFRPLAPGQYRYRLSFAGRYTFDTEELSLNVASAPGTGGRQVDAAVLNAVRLMTLDRSASVAFYLMSGKWKLDVDATYRGQFEYLSAPLEWSPPAVGYQGLGRYNLGQAFLLDRALSLAENQKLKLPYRIIGNEEFHDVSTHIGYPYRWERNPYRKVNGGPLVQPSDLFSNKDVFEYHKRRLRYIHARYVHSSSLSNLLIAADFLTPGGAAEWHIKLAAYWNSLPLPPGASRPGIISLHPQTLSDTLGTLAAGPKFEKAKPEHGEAFRFVGPERADWSEGKALLVDIELPPDAPGGMRCVVAMRDEDDWWFQAGSSLFLRPDDTTRIYLRIDSMTDFKAEGHGRPFSGYTKFAVRKPEIRIYSVKPYEGAVAVKQVQLVLDASGSPQKQAPKVLDLRMRSQKLPAGEVNQVAFDLSKVYSNPFDPTVVAIDAELTDPQGVKRNYPAFLYQAFGEREWNGRKIETPEGPLEWRILLPTKKPGPYKFRILIREHNGSPAPLFVHQFTATEHRGPTFVNLPLSDEAMKYLVTKQDRAYQSVSTLMKGQWTPPSFYSRLSLQLSGGSPSTPQPLPGMWLANLEWHSRWGRGYHGLGRFNLRYAYHFDKVLAEAEKKGKMFPLRLLGNEEFHDVSTNIGFHYRWKDNPLSKTNGGSLTGASQYFTDAEAKRRFNSLLRYLIARYGTSRAVNGVAVANDMPEPGAEAWHQALASQLKVLSFPPSHQVVSYNPQVVPMRGRVHRPSLALKELPFYKEPPPANAPGKEVRAFRNVPAGDWSRYHIARVRFQLPPDAPADMRVLLSAKDEDDWWYQKLHQAFLRPGDTSTLLFDLASLGALDPIGHTRPWTDYSRFHVADVSFRLFSSAPFKGKISLTSLEFIQLPVQAPQLKITKLGITRNHVPIGDAFEAWFTLNRHFQNPFDPAEIDISTVVRAPSGRSRRVSAFFTQSYRQQGKQMTPVGEPGWMIRFRPRETGQHSFTLEAKVGGKPIPFGDKRVFAANDESPQKVQSFESPALLRIHDLSYRSQSEYTRDTWRMLSESVNPELSLWQVVLEWTSRWGKYRNAGRYNLEVAWEFEKVLERAAAAGVRAPLRLSGNMEFFNRRKYRWPDNPLNAANGGPLSAPSQYYHNQKALALQKNLWRYLIARYGELPAVTDFILAADLAAAGAEAWHSEAGKFLSSVVPVETRLLSWHPQVLPHRKETILADFEHGFEPFKPAEDISGGLETKLGVTSLWASHGSAAMEIKRNFTGVGEAPIVAEIEQDWFDFDTLVLDVKMPASAPHDMRLLVYLKDGDLWYYQNLLEPFLVPGDVTRLIVDLSKGNKAWSPPPILEKATPWHHSKPWTDTARTRIRQIGLRIFSHKPYNGPIYVDNLQLWDTGRQRIGPPKIARIAPNSTKVPTFDRFELTLDLDRDFRNPFDSEEIDIVARFITPGNETRAVPAFYYQNYERSLVQQTCATHEKKEQFEMLTPKGAPNWKVRFTPTQPGTYRYSIAINGRQVWPERGTASFTATGPNSPGFVRIAKDKRHFEFTNGKFFYPVGHNLRSPTDGRNRDAYEGNFVQDWHRNTYLYDDFLKKMKENGLNWARVWQCSWWMGLEWTREWPGYHGVGRYNLENAWRLDHLLELARKNGVYFQLDTTNHGQLSLEIDSEWAHNPYNKNNPVDKGPLTLPRYFFSTDGARKHYSKRIRYTTARWGYDPNIFSWILLTECEFTDPYWSVAYGNEESGRLPLLVQWQEYAAGLFKSWDPNHIVSTHFSHPWRGHDVFASPAIEFVESNTYWQDWKFNEELGGPEKDTIWINRHTYEKYVGVHNKPVIIGEYGGHVKQNDPERLDIELHIGSWSMVMVPYAGSTGYWWWPWLHYMDRYSHLRAIVQFMKEEDRRGKNHKQVTPGVSGEDLACLGLQTETEADLWVYHLKSRQRKPDDLDPVAGAVVSLEGLADGAYQAEFWDTYAGKPTGKAKFNTTGGNLQIPLPQVRGDIAVKVRKVK